MARQLTSHASDARGRLTWGVTLRRDRIEIGLEIPDPRNTRSFVIGRDRKGERTGVGMR